MSYAALKALILRMRRQNVVEKLVRQMEVSMWQTIRLTVKAEEEEHGCLHLGRIFFFTILLRPDLPLNSVSMLTLVAASAVAEAVDKVTGQECQIKWPNDIVLNRKKVCGILTEMNMEIDSIAYVVVGVGINVNRMEFREDIAETATSLKKESGHSIERAELLSEILSAFFRDYKLFLEKQDLSPFLESYNQKLVNVGREVKIIKKGEEIIRTAIGINDRGELIVQDAEGNTEHIFSGEVSVRGIYGYV